MEKDVSISELLGEVHRRFAAAPLSYGHGTDNAWDEAVALVLGVTGLPDAQSTLDIPLGAEQAAAIRDLAERRIEQRRPLAYLLGKAVYCGELFHVPEGIVVPRSPIGPLLMDGLRPWVEAPAHILDLCCGSGCLGILAAKCFPRARVLLADVDPLAVSTARRNVAAHDLGSRVRIMQSDLFSGLRNSLSGSVSRRNFDLVLCNPPYVDAGAMEVLPSEFAFEPTLGLDGGGDGLAVMNRVIEEASGFLVGNGILVGEVGEAMERLEARWPGVPFFWPDLPAGGAGVFLLHARDAP